jgi:hypothetical protein
MGKGYVRHRPERQVDEATEAQVNAMQGKLAARVKQLSLPSIAQPPEVGESRNEKSALEWEKPVTGVDGVYTKCRTYACAKGLIMGQMLYSLSKRLPTGTYTPINCRLDSFMQAKELARQDWEKGA